MLRVPRLSLRYAWVGAGSTSGNCGMISIGSSKSVETSPGFGSQGVARTLLSLFFRHSSHGLNNVCPCLVHDNALSCFTRTQKKHASRPPRPQLVSSALSVVDTLAETRQLNSPGSALQTHVGSAHRCGKVREDWNSARPAKPTADSGTPAQFQISAPGSL